MVERAGGDTLASIGDVPNAAQAEQPAPAPARSPRRVPTIDTLSAGQIDAIRRIPAHNAGWPPVPHAEWLEPVIKKTRPASIFLDADRFALEQSAVFRRLPVPVIPAALLPEPGSVVAHDNYGIAMLLARGRDGVVRAFYNACQHKGSKLVEDCEHRKVSRLTCPYHSWTYGLDGRLVAAPRTELFVDFRKEDYALPALPCREFGGLIWVVLNPDVEPDWSGLDAGFEDDMNHLGIPTTHVYGRRSFELNANWKLVLEPFMESYHVTRLHAASIGDLFTDAPSICDKLGPHQRKLAGKVHFTPDMIDIPGENIHKTVTHAYQIFPNGTLITSPYYTSLMILQPRAADRTVVDYYMLTATPPDNEKAQSLYARSYELILKVFGEEDFRAAEITQAGLASGGLKTVTYGGMENTIPTYYDQLESHFPSREAS